MTLISPQIDADDLSRQISPRIARIARIFVRVIGEIRGKE
jgi:hypothetical protein